VRSALDNSEGALDPVHQLDTIGAAVARLDLALASARNQAQRLEHASAAYEGTLVSAKSQIGVVRAFIGANGAGVEARTRLAEAERQLMLAEAASDPVEALDTVRRAVTHARDADALARY
jgi:multidrug resistance efflux pump